MNAINYDAADIREDVGIDYFSMFAGIARAHAEALIPNFAERERLALQRDGHKASANQKRAQARKLFEEAFECDETAKQIDEQIGALK